MEKLLKYEGYTNPRFDLTNQRYGALTILYRYYLNTKDNKIQWVCQCDCGNTIIASGKSLRSGKRTSCGCHINIKQNKIKEIQSLYNQNFGFLTPYDYIFDEKRRRYKLICNCICGNIHIVDKSDLITGKIKSCGCKSKELNSKSHIVPLPIGYKSGQLTIIDNLEYINNEAVYKCKCSCNKIDYFLHKSLLHKYVSSCGCSKSKGEILIAQSLQELHINYKQEYSFDNLISDKGRKLKFDFALFERDVLIALIEYDGIQHFLPYGWNTPEKLLEIKKRDCAKNDYCLLNNIPLLRINYLEDDLNTIKTHIIKFLKENKICNF